MTPNIESQFIQVLRQTNFDHVRIIIMENETCPVCHWYGSMVIIYGHKECPNCKNNIEPCCEGEQQQIQCKTKPNDPCEGVDVPN